MADLLKLREWSDSVAQPQNNGSMGQPTLGQLIQLKGMKASQQGRVDTTVDEIFNKLDFLATQGRKNEYARRYKILEHQGYQMLINKATNGSIKYDQAAPDKVFPLMEADRIESRLAQQNVDLNSQVSTNAEALAAQKARGKIAEFRELAKYEEEKTPVNVLDSSGAIYQFSKQEADSLKDDSLYKIRDAAELKRIKDFNTEYLTLEKFGKDVFGDLSVDGTSEKAPSYKDIKKKAMSNSESSAARLGNFKVLLANYTDFGDNKRRFLAKTEENWYSQLRSDIISGKNEISVEKRTAIMNNLYKSPANFDRSSPFYYLLLPLLTATPQEIKADSKAKQSGIFDLIFHPIKYSKNKGYLDGK